MVAENESCFSYYSNLLHAKQIENKSRMHTGKTHCSSFSYKTEKPQQYFCGDTTSGIKKLTGHLLEVCQFRLVPVTGLEPVRCRQRWILSPLRLPIPSHRQMRDATLNIISHCIPNFKTYQAKNLSFMPSTKMTSTISGRI